MKRATPKARPAAPETTMAELRSVFTDADGRPRFTITIPVHALREAGIRALVRGESERGGYEYPTRRFIDAHLEPGDVFVDVGAHWGIFAMHAATRHRGRVHALAVEPHPGNVAALVRLMQENTLTEQIEVIAAAAGSASGTAPLVYNSSMAHSLYGYGLPDDAKRFGHLTVPVLPLDMLIGERPECRDRRVMLKIDVEGYEPEVLAGAAGLLNSGRVAVVIWEHGIGFRAGPRRDAMLAMSRDLAARGFRQYRFPHPTMGGPLVPFQPTPECCNVFALAPGIKPLDLYDKPVRRPEVLPPLERAPDDPAVRAETTRLLMETGATDAARWADFEAMRAGAAERARAVAPLIEGMIGGGARVLDVGAGVMALRDVLPAGFRYVPADLLPFDAATAVVDLNQGRFPAGGYDIVVMLNVIEFVHRPERLLATAADAAPRLIVGYDAADGGTAAARRRLGYVNDLTVADLEGVCAAAGWRSHRHADGAGLCLLECVRAS